MKKSRPFTLIEIMISLMILGLLASVSAIQIKKLLDIHRFESSISTLFSKLQEAQALASSYQTDIALDIYRRKGKYYYQLTTFEPFKPFLQIDQGEKEIDASLVQFNGKKIDQLHFDLFSGRLEPRGILAFSRTAEEDGQKLWLDVQYGHLIKFSHSKPSPNKQQLPAKK